MGALPLMFQIPGVSAGHGGGVMEGEYTASRTPLGVKVAQTLFRLEKSGVMGVGVPLRENPPAGAA